MDVRAEETRNADSSTPEGVAEKQAPTSGDADHLSLSLWLRSSLSQYEASPPAHPSEASSPELDRERATAPADAVRPVGRARLPETEEMPSDADTAETGAVGLHGLPEMEPRPTVAATGPKRAYRIRTAAVVALLLALVVFGFDQGAQKRSSVNGPDDHFASIVGPAALSASSELSGGEDRTAFAGPAKAPGVAAADPLADLPRNAPVPMAPLEASDSALAGASSLPRLDVGSHTETARLTSPGLGMSPAASDPQTAANVPPPGRLSLPVQRPVKIDEPLAVSDKFRPGEGVTGIPLAEDNLRYEQVASTAVAELTRPIDQDALLTGSPIGAAQIGAPLHLAGDQPIAASEREILAAFPGVIVVDERCTAWGDK